MKNFWQHITQLFQQQKAPYHKGHWERVRKDLDYGEGVKNTFNQASIPYQSAHWNSFEQKIAQQKTFEQKIKEKLNQQEASVNNKLFDTIINKSNAPSYSSFDLKIKSLLSQATVGYQSKHWQVFVLKYYGNTFKKQILKWAAVFIFATASSSVMYSLFKTPQTDESITNTLVNLDENSFTDSLSNEHQINHLKSTAFSFTPTQSKGEDVKLTTNLNVVIPQSPLLRLSGSKRSAVSLFNRGESLKKYSDKEGQNKSNVSIPSAYHIHNSSNYSIDFEDAQMFNEDTPNKLNPFVEKNNAYANLSVFQKNLTKINFNDAPKPLLLNFKNITPPINLDYHLAYVNFFNVAQTIDVIGFFGNNQASYYFEGNWKTALYQKKIEEYSLLNFRSHQAMYQGKINAKLNYLLSYQHHVNPDWYIQNFSTALAYTKKVKEGLLKIAFGADWQNEVMATRNLLVGEQNAFLNQYALAQLEQNNLPKNQFFNANFALAYYHKSFFAKYSLQQHNFFKSNQESILMSSRLIQGGVNLPSYKSVDLSLIASSHYFQEDWLPEFTCLVSYQQKISLSMSYLYLEEQKQLLDFGLTTRYQNWIGGFKFAYVLLEDRSYFRSYDLYKGHLGISVQKIW